MATTKNTAIKHNAIRVFKNHLPVVENGRSLFKVTLIKIIRHNISTTSWVMATSGAFKMRKTMESNIPTAPTVTTDESMLFTSAAIIAPTIINVNSM